MGEGVFTQDDVKLTA